METLDSESLIIWIQIVTLALVAVQSLPQIITLYKQKQDASKNLSLQSWIYKTLFSVFFVISLFAGETNIYVVCTQIINLTMSATITAQVGYYNNNVQLVPQSITMLDAFKEWHTIQLQEDENEQLAHEVPILHNILKQIYKFDSLAILPKLP